MYTCQHLEHILKLAETEGNTILTISKSELVDKVVWMNNYLSSAFRNKILSEVNGVEYKKTKDKPHDGATEYFLCKECKAVIVFPYKAA